MRDTKTTYERTSSKKLGGKDERLIHEYVTEIVNDDSILPKIEELNFEDFESSSFNIYYVWDDFLTTDTIVRTYKNFREHTWETPNVNTPNIHNTIYPILIMFYESYKDAIINKLLTMLDDTENIDIYKSCVDDSDIPMKIKKYIAWYDDGTELGLI